MSEGVKHPIRKKPFSNADFYKIVLNANSYYDAYYARDCARAILTLNLFGQNRKALTSSHSAEDARLTGSAYKSTAYVADIDDTGSLQTFDPLIDGIHGLLCLNQYEKPLAVVPAINRFRSLYVLNTA